MKIIKVGLFGLFFICFLSVALAQQANKTSDLNRDSIFKNFLHDKRAIIKASPARVTQQASTPTRTAYDKESNVTTVTIKSGKTTNLKAAKSVEFDPYYKFDGKTPSVVSSEGITIVFIADESTELAHDMELKVFVDGELEGPYMTWEDKISHTEAGDAFVHLLAGSADRIIKKIASAKKVVCQLGPMEFELSPVTISQIKALYSKLPKRSLGLSTEYIEDSKMTYVTTDNLDTLKLRNARTFILTATYGFSGKVQKSVDRQGIVVIFGSNLYITKNPKLELSLTIDGTPAGRFPLTDMEDTRLVPGVHSYMITSEGSTVIEKIAHGNKVECQVDEITFELDPEAVDQIKTLYKKIHQN